MSDYQAMRNLRKSLAASALLAFCETLAESGYLPGQKEMALRILSAELRIAFGPDVPEREFTAHNVVKLRPMDEYTRALNAVSQEIT
jgi:hypothetical protein